ncbi:MAG: hypothetical protein ACTHXA_09625 [Gulosibacter sp.]|uniref:hypothetical protein n=1 Tax=Gulosibacter sp. TaxID=2817531 RepID=UPI003F938288
MSNSDETVAPINAIAAVDTVPEVAPIAETEAPIELATLPALNSLFGDASGTSCSVDGVCD